jgi:hypothetical protein
MAGSYIDGTWRYDTSAGWAHISNMQASRLDVDDGGDVYAKYVPGNANDGLWRWSASSMSWQKLSSLSVTAFQVTAGGVLYGNFGSNGTWRWDSTSGWMMLSGSSPAIFAVSDTDTFFGRYDAAGTVGTWRWTVASGWQLLSGNRPDTLNADGQGDLVGVYNTYIASGQQGTWRWSPTTSWTRLSTVVANNIGVSSNGAIYENRGSGGLWYAAAGATSFTEIDSATQTNANLFALPNGSLYIDRYDTTAGQYTGWYYSPSLQGLGFVKIINNTISIYPAVVGKDGDLFYYDNATPGTGYWSLTSAYHTVSNKVPSLLASQR